MSKTIGVIQSNYIPWRGYFDFINSVDEFILYDDAQYTRRDWRNRNRIKTPRGPIWLTIPVQVKGKYSQKIKDTVVADNRWARDHWRSIAGHYAKARYFSDFRDRFEELYLRTEESRLSQINYRFIVAICGMLGISTKISWSMDYQLIGDKTARIMNLCRQAGATKYLSGPSAKSYLDEDPFRAQGIEVAYIDYSSYGTYQQQYPPFESQVSVIDLILNEGPGASAYLMSF